MWEDCWDQYLGVGAGGHLYQIEQAAALAEAILSRSGLHWGSVGAV